MNKQTIWYVLGVLFILTVMFSVVAVDVQSAVLAYNTSNFVAGTNSNVNTYGGTSGRMLQNFTALGNLTKVGLNISNYSTTLTPVGTFVNIRILYDSQVAAGMSNATNISNLTFPLPNLDLSVGTVNGTWVEFDFGANKVTLNISQSYTVLYQFLGGGTGKNINGKQTSADVFSGISSSIAGGVANSNELLTALYFENVSSQFTVTAKDYYDNQSLSFFSVSVNGSNYNQTFNTTNSSVVVYPLADMSGNNKTVTGTTIYQNSSGAIGESKSFIATATDEFLYSPNTTTFANNISWAGWIYLTNTTTSRTIWSKSGDYTNFFVIDINSANLRVNNIIGGNTKNCNQATATISANYWHHLGLTVNSTHTVLYVNGTQVQSCAYSSNGMGTNTANLTIGRRWDSTVTNKWVGSLDEMYWFNETILSASDFTALYQKRPISQSSSLYLPFENITSTSSDPVSALSDKSGTSNTLNNSNASFNGTSYNGYYSFNGTSSYLQGNNLYINTNQSTVCAWVNPNAVQSAYVLSQYGSSNQGFTLYQSNSVYLMYFSNGNSIQTSAVAVAGYWTHICGAVSGTNKLIYINGTLYNSQNTANGAYSSTNQLYIGRDITGGYWNGNLDNFVVYNRNVSQSEITALYQNGTPNPNGLVAYYDFNTAGTLYNLTTASTQNGGYFQRLYADYNTSATLAASMWQSIASFTGTQKYTGASVGAVQANVTNQSNTSTLYLKAGTYSGTFGATGYFAQAQQFSTTALSSQAFIVENFSNAQLNVSLLSQLTGLSVTTFNASIIALDYGDAYEQTSTTTGSVLFNLTNGTYNVTIDANGYALDSVLLYVNGSAINYQRFNVYTTNSINFTFRDAYTYASMNGTLVTASLIGDSSYSFSTSNGSYYIDLVSPSDYIVRYNATGYPLQYAYLTVTNRTSQNQTLYLIPSTGSTLVTMTIYNADVTPAENVFVKILRYNVTTNTYVLIQTIETSNAGELQFYASLSTEYYQFMFEKPFGTLLETSDPSLITSATLTYILSETQVVQNFYDLIDISSYIAFNQATNNFRITFSDPNNALENVCMYIYRNTSPTVLASNCTGSGVYSGTLLVNYAIHNGTVYNAIAYGTIGGTDYLLNREMFDFRQDTQTSAVTVLIIAAVTLVMIFALREQGLATILVVTPIPLIIASAVQFVLIPLWIAAAIEILAIILAYMAGRRG